jgi:hypothetical protein
MDDADACPLLGDPLLGDEHAQGANRCQGFHGASVAVGDEQAAARSKLVYALLICVTAVLVEVVGGVLAHSLALLTDAAHLLSDLSGYLIGLFALWAVSLQASQKSSFGYHRECARSWLVPSPANSLRVSERVIHVNPKRRDGACGHRRGDTGGAAVHPRDLGRHWCTGGGGHRSARSPPCVLSSHLSVPPQPPNTNFCDGRGWE